MATPEEEWYTKLNNATKSIEDAPFVIEWYSQSKDRSRNPFQLRGFGDSIRNIISLLIENMNLLLVSDDDRNAFLESFRKYLKSNPGLNKDDDALPKILEFFYKSGDYNLLMPTGQNMCDLFCGYARNASEIQFDSFYNHFDGVGKKVLETIEFPKYFFFGLNDDPAYVFFRRSHDHSFIQSELKKPDDKNITPYFFMKTINEIFDKKTVDALNEAKLQFDENKDKSSFEFMYKLQVEKVFIKIVIAMIEHITKYYKDKFYTNELITDPQIKKDTHISDLVTKLLNVLTIHVNINSFVNSSEQYAGFARAQLFITTNEDSLKRQYNINQFGNSKTEQLRALEIFYKKLQKVRDFDTPVSLGDFWDKFDSVVIDAAFEKKYNFRSYMYRNDFDPSNILIQGVRLDSQVIFEIDQKIQKEQKHNFSSVISVFMNKEFMFWFFFKHLREFFDYTLEESLSPYKDQYLEKAREQELAVKRGEPIPSPEPFEEQWAEEVPRPLIVENLTTLEDFSRALEDFKAMVKRFIGNKQIKKFLEDLNQTFSGPNNWTLEAKKVKLKTLMERYMSLRPALVKYVGQSRPIVIRDRPTILAVDNSDGVLYFYTVHQMIKRFLKTDENLMPAMKGGKFVETGIPSTIATNVLTNLGSDLFDLEAPPVTEFELNGLIKNPFFASFRVGDVEHFYIFDDNSRLCHISNKVATFLTPPIKKETKVFKQHVKDSLYLFYKNPDTAISIVTIQPNSLPVFASVGGIIENETSKVVDVKSNFQNKIVQFVTDGKRAVLYIDDDINYSIPLDTDITYSRFLPDPTAEVYYLIGQKNTGELSSFIYRFIPNNEPTVIAKLPGHIKSIVYQDNKKRFVSVNKSNEIFITDIIESAIDEPLDQPDLPETSDQIFDWWRNVKGLDAQRKVQFELALNKVIDVVEPYIYENILEMLAYGMRPAEFKNIYLPMLVELYELKESAGTGDGDADGGDAGGGGAGGGGAGGGGAGGGGDGNEENNSYLGQGGGSRNKNNSLQTFLQAFIDGSTKNPEMKANLRAIANSPSEDYKSRILYEVEKPNQTLLAKYYS